jgi:hypothetical protein
MLLPCSLERPAEPPAKHNRRLPAIAGAIALVVAAGASAGPGAATNHKHVVNLAGMQRMLSQKMSKEALLIALEIDKEQNLWNLDDSRATFDRTLTGLRDGDVLLGLPATTRPEILDDLHKVEELWPPLHAAIKNSVTSKQVSALDVDTIAELNVPLLKAMDDTVKEYERAARGSELISVLAVAINLAGRQRMLTQKMSKEFFLIAYGQNEESNRRTLGESMDLFERTLEGLIYGNDDLLAAPTPNIKAQLKRVEHRWLDFRALLEPTLEGRKPDPDTIAKVAQQNMPLLEEMNKAVFMYESL